MVYRGLQRWAARERGGGTAAESLCCGVTEIQADSPGLGVGSGRGRGFWKMKTLQLLALSIWIKDVLAFSVSLRSCSYQKSNACAISPSETIPVLYNNRHGGFRYSKKALNEYNKRLPSGAAKIDVERGQGRFSRAYAEHARKAETNQVEKKSAWDIKRHDPLMVQVCSKLGVEANGEYAEIAIAQVPRKFENHYYIAEYDGLESVEIDFQGYQLDRIKSIVQQDSLSSDDKVKMTRDVLLEEYEGDLED